ncbi:endo alpha-1,4 polygalactosaminidase [Athalassotoga saccharophila]|uniref:endo alpha-1,4 polygalactosaminidase n=1 Tax=Athalassotoga saccharophila TaxID=1441386 RepID=UPI00137A3FFF|nr:endo alpha-1,4 polygalactosaminidase [Athalassotoga saccharophila]BBJ28190.1 signal peptide protein [Athalassotoga saccharophila]
MRKILVFIILTFTSLILFANPIDGIKNFVFYYGKDDINQLSKYDLAVVQPDSYSTSEIKEIESHGVKLIAYMSIGESDNKNVDPSWILAKNENWNSYMIDVRKQGWRDYILNVLAKKIKDMGYNGFFLDTVDTAVQFPQTADAMVSLIKEIREKYPDMIIIQNRGFPLLSKTGPYIDGVLWEDFASKYNFINGTYEKVDINPVEVDRQVNLAKKFGYKILALSYAGENDYNLMNYIFSVYEKYDVLGSITNLYINSIYTYKPGMPIPVLTYSSTNVSSEIYFNPERPESSTAYIYGPGWSKPESIVGIWYRRCEGWDAGAVLTFNATQNSTFLVIYFDGGLNDFALQISAYDGTNWPMIASIPIGDDNMPKATLVNIDKKYLYDVDSKIPGIQEKLGFKGGRIAYIGRPDMMEFALGNFGYRNNKITFTVRNVGINPSKQFEILVYNSKGQLIKDVTVDQLGPNEDYKVSVEVNKSFSPLKIVINPGDNKEFDTSVNTTTVNF